MGADELEEARESSSSSWRGACEEGSLWLGRLGREWPRWSLASEAAVEGQVDEVDEATEEAEDLPRNVPGAKEVTWESKTRNRGLCATGRGFRLVTACFKEHLERFGDCDSGGSGLAPWVHEGVRRRFFAIW